MNVTFNKLNDVTGELNVVIEEADYSEKVKQTLKKLSQSRPEPGFRPGKTPVALLQKKYGKQAKLEAIDDLVADAVYNFIREEKLPVLGQPLAQPSEAFNPDDKQFVFTFKLGLAPEVNVTVGKDMKVPYYTISVSEEMIDEQSNALRQRFGKQVPGEEVEDKALVKGVMTQLNAEGQTFEGGLEVESAIVSPSHFENEDQRKLFEGKKVGDLIVFNPAASCNGNEVELSSMLNVDREKAAEYKGDFSFEIKEIIVLRPAELDQEFYDLAFGKDQVHNEEEYRAAVKLGIERSLAGDQNYRFSLDARKAIVDAAGALDLPEDVLVEMLVRQNDGVSEEQAREEFAKMRDDLCWQIVRDHVAEQLEVKLEEKDITELAKVIVRQQLAQYGMANVPEDLLNKYADEVLKDKKQREQIANNAADMKFFAKVKETVTVDDKTVSVEEFNKLFEK